MICLHQTAALQFRLLQLCDAARAQSSRACWGSLQRWGKNKSQWWRFKLREKKWEKKFYRWSIQRRSSVTWCCFNMDYGALRFKDSEHQYHHHFRLKTFWLLSNHPSVQPCLAQMDTDNHLAMWRSMWSQPPFRLQTPPGKLGTTYTLVYSLERLLKLPNKKNFQLNSLSLKY